MKKLFIMLLIACSAVTTVNAQEKRQKPTNALNPNNVIESFEFIIDL